MICMMNVPYVVLKYATLLLSFPINNVVEVVLTTLNPVLKSTNNPSHLQGTFNAIRILLVMYMLKPIKNIINTRTAVYTHHL